MKTRICRILLCLMILAFVAGELFGTYVSKLLFDKHNSQTQAEELTLQFNLMQSSILAGDYDGYEKAKENASEIFAEFKDNSYTKENYQNATQLVVAYFEKLDTHNSEIREITTITRALTTLRKSAVSDSDINNTQGYYEAFAQELDESTLTIYRNTADKYARYARRLGASANEIAVCYNVCPKNLIEEKNEKYQQALSRIDSIKEEMKIEDYSVSEIVEALKIQQ